MFYIGLVDVKNPLPENYLGKIETCRSFDVLYVKIYDFKI